MIKRLRPLTLTKICWRAALQILDIALWTGYPESIDNSQVSRVRERFPYPRPSVRPLKIYAFDPMLASDPRTRISVDTRNEPLGPGPAGGRIVVIDYDSVHECYYTPTDLDDKAVLMQGGIDHAEGDPRFHQQMVYAVASRVLEIFDRALGRPISLGGAHNGQPRPLRLFPHAIGVPNAFYHKETGALVFGYFPTEQTNVGRNMPGQLIFTCLSHDIIAHELTHALIHNLNPYLSNPRRDTDCYALHEGLADLVPILHRFSFDSIVRAEIRRTRGRLDVNSPLVQIAAQFGAALGNGQGLRNAWTEAAPDQYTKVKEPHALGTVLTSAVFDALLTTYRARVEDLLQVAGTRWTGADDDLHPDLVDRMAVEASRTALSLLTMCIRAFDYLPPIDVSFGDFLRALVTADKALVANDIYGQRNALIEGFRRRGIYATGARSLAEESLIWEGPETPVAPLPPTIVSALTRTAQAFRRIRVEEGDHTVATELDAEARDALMTWGGRHTEALKLSPDLYTEISTIRHNFRVAPDGQLVIEIIVQMVQRDQPDAALLPVRGVTLVASADGTIRYVIPNQEPPTIERDTGEHTGQSEPYEVALEKAAPQAPARPPWPEPFSRRFRIEPPQFRKRYPQLCLTDEERAILVTARRG